jgi:hypothetical protein
MLGLGLMNLDDKKLKTIALALFDKSRLEMVRWYIDGIRPSDIAHFLGYDRKLVRGRIQKTIKVIDLNMVKDNVIYKKLMDLEDIYNHQNEKCKLCGKRKHYTEMLNHLLASHLDILEQKLKEVLS